MTTSAPFRYLAKTHTYVDLSTGEIRPHITGLLKSGGHVDDRFFNDEASKRGTAVHKITADFDLKALDVAHCKTAYRGYLLGYAEAMGIFKAEMLTVEVARLHPRYRFAGRLDRTLRRRRAFGVLEVKTGEKPSVRPDQLDPHGVQTALQAILVEPEAQIPAWAIQRWIVYLRPNGRYELFQHKERRELDEALRLIRRFAS